MPVKLPTDRDEERSSGSQDQHRRAPLSTILGVRISVTAKVVLPSRSMQMKQPVHRPRFHDADVRQRDDGSVHTVKCDPDDVASS